MWPMIPASDRFSFCLLMVLLAFHRSKTPCRPARPSPAGEGPGPGRRAGLWPPEEGFDHKRDLIIICDGIPFPFIHSWPSSRQDRQHI